MKKGSYGCPFSFPSCITLRIHRSDVEALDQPVPARGALAAQVAMEKTSI
jgi:hypothetical protein